MKAVQSLVASGATSPITVSQARTVTILRSALEPPWGLQDMEVAFLEPEPSGQRGLDHMVSALRTIGLREKRCFELCLAGQSEALVWDGARTAGPLRARSSRLADLSMEPLQAHNIARCVCASDAWLGASLGLGAFLYLAASPLTPLAAVSGVLAILVRFAERHGQKGLLTELLVR